MGTAFSGQPSSPMGGAMGNEAMTVDMESLRQEQLSSYRTSTGEGWAEHHKEQLAEANTALAEERWLEAKSAFTQLLQVYSRDVDATMGYIEATLNLNEYSSAQLALEALLLWQPTHWGAMLALDGLYLFRDGTPGALPVHRLVQLLREDVAALRRGRPSLKEQSWYWVSGQHNQSASTTHTSERRSEYQELLPLPGQSFSPEMLQEWLLSRAEHWYGASKPERMLFYLRPLAMGHRGLHEAKLLMARAYQGLDDIAAALIWYDQLLNDPGATAYYGTAHLEMAELFLEEGESNEAREHYLNALQFSLSSFERIRAWDGLASHWMDLRDYGKAKEAFEHLFQLDPNHGFAWYDYVHMLFEQKQYQTAKKILTQRLEHDPEDGESLQLLAEVYGRLGDSRAETYYGDLARETGQLLA